MSRRRQDRSAKWQLLSRPGPGEGYGYGQVRYSSDSQDIRSLNEQKDRIRAVFEREQWKLLGFVEEPELSASYDDLDYRPQFARLLTDLAGKECNVIVCDETSRWARSAEVGHKSLRLLRERRCWWETVSDDWNINKPLSDGGAIMWAIAQGMNEDYSRKLSFHTRKGKAGKAKEGYSNGIPMYGYRVPEIVIPPNATALDIRKIRSRLVYEPDPAYFSGLQRFGELAAQSAPSLSFRDIADEMNRLGFRYYSTRHHFEGVWNVERVYGVLKREFPREYMRGNGKGTIVHPDGSYSEGLHVSAWPYELWQRMEESRRLYGRRPPRYKKRLAGPLQGLVSCRHCTRVMRYREDIRTKQTVAKSMRTYHTFYYYCREHLRYECSGGRNGKGSFVDEHLLNGQFGLLLALLGNWSDAASQFIKSEYARQERERGDVNDFLTYESMKAKLSARREQVNDMFEMQTIDRTGYLSRLEAIRKEESALVQPRESNTSVEQCLKAARQIDMLATQWDKLSGDKQMRRKIAHALIVPGGLVYDSGGRRIVGVRPLPDFYEAFRCILITEGWSELDGMFWHDSYDLVPPPKRRTRYHEIVDMLREGQHAMSALDIAAATHMSISNTNMALSLLFRKGYLIRADQKTGTTKKYLYRSNGKPFKGEAMVPRKKGA
jgi:DNA invertase Pin-like site-specific DNA recombinase